MYEGFELVEGLVPTKVNLNSNVSKFLFSVN